jgi:rhamnogalacturonan acetylesterase
VALPPVLDSAWKSKTEDPAAELLGSELVALEGLAMNIAKLAIWSIVVVLAMTSTRSPAADAPTSKPTLWIVGDSTVRNGTKGERGWGEDIGKLFDPSKINVENHAMGGRSSRTFITEGRWKTVLDAAKPGDFVLIQFGHNDGGPLDDAARARGTIRGIGDETRDIDNPITKAKETVHTYGWYMRQYISDARAHGLTPIVCSPIPHCPKDTVHEGDLEKSGYVGWAKDVATAEKTDFIQLNGLIMTRYAAMTPDKIKSDLFTTADNTHTSPAGAEINAACVVEGIRALDDCKLKDDLLPATK